MNGRVLVERGDADRDVRRRVAGAGGWAGRHRGRSGNLTQLPLCLTQPPRAKDNPRKSKAILGCVR